MPFFQSAFFNPAAADPINNIFQLINDIDSYQREAAGKPQLQARQPVASQLQQQSPRNSPQGFFGVSRPFNPRFDVRETKSTYELHGELAGVDRNNISLEFTEPQTLVISGSVERNYSSGNPPAAAPPARVEAAPETATPEAIADTHSEPDDEPLMRDGARTPADGEEPFTEIAAPRTPSPARSHRATVTDEATEEALERGKDVANDKTAVATTAPASAPAQKTPSAAEEPAERYWYQERAVGQFKRVFSFPVPVDEAGVRASLENGILNVSIPKAKRESRRIAIL